MRLFALLSLLGFVVHACADEPKLDQKEIIALFEKRGGTVERDEKQPDKPVVAIDF